MKFRQESLVEKKWYFMHNYLRAVGFSKYTKKSDMEEVLERVIKDPDRRIVAGQEKERAFVQMEKCFGEDFGLCVCGEYDEDGTFDLDYYYPFFYGYGLTTNEQPGVERHAAKESYAGLCDDFRVGISIIFYVNNAAVYKRHQISAMDNRRIEGVVLSGLSNRGNILLPVNKTERQKEADKEAVKERGQLILAARQGDEEALESLTLEDLDIFSMVGRRVANEDILSIVETYFMPRGIECDQYTILGEILDFRLEKNHFTKEEVYVITVNCNEMIFDVCINQADLLGEPEIGRRLKADIWLQGTLYYENPD